MSSLRIRYRENKEALPGVLKSVRFFEDTKNGARYRIEINLNDKTWMVIDDVVDAISANGMAKSPHKLKIAAKEALEQLLGESFSKEDRGIRVSGTWKMTPTVVASTEDQAE